MAIPNAYCPICGSQSLTSEPHDEGEYDVHTCGNSHRYIEVAATTTPQTTENPKNMVAIDPKKLRRG